VQKLCHEYVSPELRALLRGRHLGGDDAQAVARGLLAAFGRAGLKRPS
jgi:hypothetical protein